MSLASFVELMTYAFQFAFGVVIRLGLIFLLVRVSRIARSIRAINGP
jgi:hypothetical protein